MIYLNKIVLVVIKKVIKFYFTKNKTNLECVCLVIFGKSGSFPINNDQFCEVILIQIKFSIPDDFPSHKDIWFN